MGPTRIGKHSAATCGDDRVNADELRLRRIQRRSVLGKWYEVELPGPGQRGHTRRVVTRSPVALFAPILGVGDAWALVDAADRARTGERGEWVTRFGAP
jgi:hypothetical protein